MISPFTLKTLVSAIDPFRGLCFGIGHQQMVGSVLYDRTGLSTIRTLIKPVLKSFVPVLRTITDLLLKPYFSIDVKLIMVLKSPFLW